MEWDLVEPIAHIQLTEHCGTFQGMPDLPCSGDMILCHLDACIDGCGIMSQLYNPLPEGALLFPKVGLWDDYLGHLP